MNETVKCKKIIKKIKTIFLPENQRYKKILNVNFIFFFVLVYIYSIFAA